MILIDKLKNKSLMKELMLYFIIIIAFMGSLTAYTAYGFRNFYNTANNMIDDLLGVYSISVSIENLNENIVNYTKSGNIEYVEQYNRDYDELFLLVEKFQSESTGISYNYMRDINRFLLTFDAAADTVIDAYDNNFAQIYINREVFELEKVRNYIKDDVLKLLFEEKLRHMQNYYTGVSTRIASVEILTFSLTIFMTIICVMFALKFSKDISSPIHQLAERLQKFSEGDLNVKKIKNVKNYEIGILADSFNTMIVRIRNLINEIKEKTGIETKLKEQEIKNLEVSNLLKESELNFLQSQINPHFLFNTMNSIAVLADIEEASQTKKMLECMSSILRYNLKEMNNKVTLKEEFEIVKAYLHIQSVRFGDRIKYKLNIDEKAMDIKVPSMILQPFVENAIMHGLEPKEGNGLLQIDITDSKDFVDIKIEDDGIGISPDKLKVIRRYAVSGEKDSPSLKGKKPNPLNKTGLGIKNVIMRLKLTFDKNVVQVKSVPDEGTLILIRLPKL